MLGTNHAPGPGPTLSVARRLGRRVLAIVLGLALPTGFLAWVFGFDAIKRRINGSLWCRGADEVLFDVNITRNGSTTGITDALVCRDDGATIRTVGDLQMMATNIGVAFAVSLALFGLLVLSLVALSKARRMTRP